MLSFRAEANALVLWPLVFGVALTVLRLFVLLAFGAGARDMTDVAAFLIAVPGQVAFGVLLAAAFHFLRHKASRWLVHLLLWAIVALNVAAFHYEAVFGRLPGAALLYYATEARHLASSAGAHAPLIAIVLEVAITAAVLSFAAERLTRLQPRRMRDRVAMAIACLSVVITAVLLAAPSLVPRKLLWPSRVPLLWAAQSVVVQRSYGDDAATIAPREVFEFQRQLGHRFPFGGVDPRYPLCAAAPRNEQAVGNGRSVILVVLESIATAEMNLEHEGRAVMPNLKRIAAQGLLFSDIKASGTKSLQAMPSLFAGIPPQTAGHMLWKTPLNHVEGFPLLLRQRGYRTVYVHGGDLSFEQQRPFLKMAGFEEIREFDLSKPFLGWGYPDDVAFRELQQWIARHRASAEPRPYLATLFTLSTHDPFALPPGRAKVFQGSGFWSAFVESAHFLDEQLGLFYDWYLQHEAPRGTLLLVTGDHAPHLAGNRHLEDGEVTRFEVPLVIHGSGVDAATAKEIGLRRGAQHDIPATLLSLTGLAPGRCDQGLDLLMPPNAWPAERTLYSVAGDQREEFHVFFADARVHVDLATRQAFVKPAAPGVTLTPQRHDEIAARAVDFFKLANRISRVLMKHDAYAPPPPTVRLTRRPLPRVTRPLFVAHRGQSRGELAPHLQNKRAAIEQAIRDGFQWVEIDVNVTRDGVPVIVHDATVPDATGRQRPIASLTLTELRAFPRMSDVMTLQEALATFGDRVNLLVEIKPQKNVTAHSAVTLRAAAAIRDRTTGGSVIMDSFSPTVAASLVQHCRCPVGQDAPLDRAITQAWIDNAALTGLQWIYVHHKQVNAALVRYAHERGLRVMVYTVNAPEELAKLNGEWPDGIITDRATLAASLLGVRGQAVAE